MSTHSTHEAGLAPLARSVTPDLLPAAPVAFPPGYRLPVGCTDPDLIQRYVATQMGRTVEACLEIGHGLVALKALCSHGNFLVRLREIGIRAILANRFMAVSRRFSNAESMPILHVVGNQSKLFELLPLDSGKLEELSRKGKIGPLVLSDVPSMTVKALREAVWQCRDEAGQGAAALHPGDRIESHLAHRPGSVVKVYPDGSACVCWDDGEPQEAGLGHERVPRHCLTLLAPPEGKLARRKAYLTARLKTILRYADELELNGVDDALEELVSDITKGRYVPGLVAADYDLSRKFFMVGGAQ